MGPFLPHEKGQKPTVFSISPIRISNAHCSSQAWFSFCNLFMFLGGWKETGLAVLTAELHSKPICPKAIVKEMSFC
jgi:hypothetical protein